MSQKRANKSKQDPDMTEAEESQGAHALSSTEALLMQMINLMQEKDDRHMREEEHRRLQEEERRQQEEDRRRQEEDNRRQDEDRRFQALLQAFSQRTESSSTVNSSQLPATSSPVSTSSQKRPTTSMPSKLLPDATFTAFKHWKRGWEDFSLTAGITALPQDHQIAYLRQALSTDMQCILRNNIGVEDDSSLPVDDIVVKIEDYFKSQRNQALRRLNYNRCRQNQGEDIMPFVARLRQTAADADLCDTCRDTRIFYSVISGLIDEHDELRVKLLALKPNTDLDEALAICSSYESARKTSAEVTGNKSISAISQYRKHKKKSQDYKQQQQDKSKEKNQTQYQKNGGVHCYKCGNKRHNQGDKCPASGKLCETCKKVGHFTSVCKSRSNKGKGMSPSIVSSVTLRSIANNLSCPPTPTIEVRVCHEHTVQKFKFIPDTGSEISAITPQQLHTLGLSSKDLHPALPVNFQAANGTNIHTLGRVQVLLSYGGASTKAWIDVCEGLSNALLSWMHTKELRIIPQDYPESMMHHVMLQTRSESYTRIHSGSPLPEFTSVKEARQYFLQEFSDVLIYPEMMDKGATLREMLGPAMKIRVKASAEPFCLVNSRTIPLAWQQAAQTEIKNMVAQGIIEPVGAETSEWCHPIVVVPKPKGGVRITTDFTKLNPYVSRPAHPFPTPHHAVRQVTPGSCYFSTLDCIKGYWQIPIAKESRCFTTFITPWGRFRYCRAPMGLVSSGDEFCRRVDKALDGINQYVKVVDDILTWDKDLQVHLQRLNDILTSCRNHGITLNAAKFVIGAPSVTFCGYKLSCQGIEADEEKVAAIKNFPTPTNLTDLRSFIGLVNQLADFTPAISTSMTSLRPLLSSKRVFQWMPEHQTSFDSVKQALSEPPVLAHFNPDLPTALHTDASRLYGVGYALLQQNCDDKWQLIQCGSRFLTDTETRYATIELEMLAIVWGMHKCKYYLLGLPTFKLVTDHKPLIPILNSYTLDAVSNPRIQRLKEKITGYVFEATWKAGKTHAIPDALSRAPVSHPEATDNVLAEDTTYVVRNCISVNSVEISSNDDPVIERIRSTAKEDSFYKRLQDFVIKQGTIKNKQKLDPDLWPYWTIRDHLSCDNGIVLYGARLIIPAALRRQVLARLHDAHTGIEATKRRARQTVWWPGINNDIKTTVEACQPCQIYMPSLQREPLMNDAVPSRPFEDVSADLFSVSKKSFLCYADRFSGWSTVGHYSSDTTTQATIRLFRRMFQDLGVPVRLRTDGGPQFSSSAFRDFMQEWGVQHIMSSPHYPQSNGHAESHVKSLKYLIEKTSRNGNVKDSDDFAKGLLELRNTPRADGLSPAQILLGRPLRSCVPAHKSAFQPTWHTMARDYDKRHALKESAVHHYNRQAKPLSQLNIGDHVRIQDHRSKRWELPGTVVSLEPHRSYLIKTPSGRVYHRNRRFIRLIPSPDNINRNDSL